MSTIYIQKSELKKIINDQKEHRYEIEDLKKIILDSLKDELKPSVIKRLEFRSKRMDEGQGKRFSSVKSLKSYLETL